MPMPRARTRAEAQLYMSLVPCPCGEADFDRDVDVVQVRGPRILQYSGYCVRCGRPREFVFELPDRADDEDTFGQGRSSLIDAGEWLLISDMFHEGLRDFAEQQRPTDEAAPAVLDALRTSASAIDQVLAFVPPGGTRVADDGFWTDRGMAVRDVLPDRFSVEALQAARKQRWRDVTDFEDVHPAAVADGDAP